MLTDFVTILKTTNCYIFAYLLITSFKLLSQTVQAETAKASIMRTISAAVTHQRAQSAVNRSVTLRLIAAHAHRPSDAASAAEMNRCLLAAALFNVLSQNLVSARSLVVIDIGTLRRHLDQAQPHRSRRAGAGADDSSAHDFRPADYLRTVLSILYSYKDEDLEESVSDLARELTQLKYSNNGLYNIVIDKVLELQKKPTNEIKEQILDWMQLLDNELFTDLTLKLRSVNEMQAAAELMNILQILDNYRYRSKKRSFDLAEAVKASLRSAMNFMLGPEPTTLAPPMQQPRDIFNVSPRTMRALVEAVNFAYKWINILSEKKKDENLSKIIKNVNLPKKEKDLLRQHLNLEEKDSDVLEQLYNLKL